MWSRAWVNGADHFVVTDEPYRVIQDRGRGLVIQGTRDWRDYRVETDLTVHMASSAGIAARVQGMRRYYALLLTDAGSLRLVKVVHEETVLAEASAAAAPGETHRLALEVRAQSVVGFLDGRRALEVEDSSLDGGAVALVCEEGRMAAGPVDVGPCSG